MAHQWRGVIREYFDRLDVDANTPIIWDFDQITKITAQPMDQKPLTITGGRL
jgi:hypothetical protein